MLQPLKLIANQPEDRFYRGGTRIKQFRETGKFEAVENDNLRVPEDWVGSITPLFGEETLGLTILPNGRSLRDEIIDDAKSWLGKEHYDAYGADTYLLVKLLDCGERLLVHAHPDREFSDAHLGLVHGKTESWIALVGGPVYVGFNRDISLETLKEWVYKQDIDSLRASLNRIDLKPGDAILVPAGMPHAIGKGLFVIEAQEPTDLSIMAEWQGFDIDGYEDGHLQLGLDIALQAINRKGYSQEEIEKLRGGNADSVGPLLPHAKDFFRADRMVEGSEWQAGFGIMIVTNGEGYLSCDISDSEIRAGETWLIPYAAGNCKLIGNDIEVVLCRPPLPKL